MLGCCNLLDQVKTIWFCFWIATVHSFQIQTTAPSYVQQEQSRSDRGYTQMYFVPIPPACLRGSIPKGQTYPRSLLDSVFLSARVPQLKWFYFICKTQAITLMLISCFLLLMSAAGISCASSLDLYFPSAGDFFRNTLK